MKIRPRLILVLAVALVGAAGAWIVFWQSRPVGAGPAGPALPIAAFTQPWTQRLVLLVGLGDSVTAGFGARRGYGYFDRLASNPPDEFSEMRRISLSTVLPGLHTTNFAVSGSTSLEHAEKQLQRLPTAGSNVLGIVVITTGGNDLIHNYGRTPPRQEAMYGATWEEAAPWVKNFEARLESILAQVNSRFPGGCHVFLANIYDPTDGVGDIQRTGLPAWRDGLRILAAYNDVIRRCAERHENVKEVNVHAAFLGHGIHCRQFWAKHYDSHDPHYWYYDNLEDPNERGYDVIRRLFLAEIMKLAPQIK